MNPNVEKILKLPAWQRGLILLAVVVLVVAGFFWGLYLPAMDE
ncbi:MAG: pilus assembly protein PilO, partial [Desulfuromonas sp.]